LLLQVNDVDVSGRAFQQYVDGVANQYPGAEKNEYANDCADKRICI
jgi:hypothetical protein